MEGQRPMPPRPDLRTVLVIPEGIPIEYESLFGFALRAAAEFPDHRFIFRCHPVLPFEAIRPSLPVPPERFPNIEISERASLTADCARSSVALYRGSSAVLYAVLHGLKPFYLHDGRVPNADPLFALTQWRQTVTSLDEFRDGLARYAATPSAEAVEQWRSSADYATEYTRPMNDASLDQLLDAVGLRDGGGSLR